MQIIFAPPADGQQVLCYNNCNLFVRLPEQEVNMKQQPDKMTAYYYRAAHINTDLNLDNQMYRLLHHAMTNGMSIATKGGDCK